MGPWIYFLSNIAEADLGKLPLPKGIFQVYLCSCQKNQDLIRWTPFSWGFKPQGSLNYTSSILDSHTYLCSASVDFQPDEDDDDNKQRHADCSRALKTGLKWADKTISPYLYSGVLQAKQTCVIFFPCPTFWQTIRRLGNCFGFFPFLPLSPKSLLAFPKQRHNKRAVENIRVHISLVSMLLATPLPLNCY